MLQKLLPLKNLEVSSASFSFAAKPPEVVRLPLLSAHLDEDEEERREIQVSPFDASEAAVVGVACAEGVIFSLSKTGLLCVFELRESRARLAR